MENPGRTVVSYVNTNAEIKALSDIICTSSNAVQIVESLPVEEKIIFAPDRNLGNYILNKTGRDMVIWNGTCHVHEEFSLEAIIRLKKENPEAKIIVHPECELPVRLVADFIGSTSSLLQFTKKDKGNCYIVATEVGIIHQMKKENPEKSYIPVPPVDSTCGCSECSFMKLITIGKILNCLKNEEPEIIIDNEILIKAQKPIKRMMEISEKLGL
jgi:quinolinate synthase